MPVGVRPPQPAPIDRKQILGNVKRVRIRRLLSEKAKREMESLRLYVPLPNQLEFHKSDAPERLAIGGNRCLAGETMIYDPVAGRDRQLQAIEGDFHVYANDDGQRVIAEAVKPFLKGVDDLYRVTLDTGQSFISTLAHLVLTADGRWRSVGDIQQDLASSVPVLLGSISDVFQSGLHEGVRHCRKISPHGPSVVSVEFVRRDKFYDFTVPIYHNYELAGIVHHNSGKTTTVAVELAWILTGTHPYLNYPKENGRAFVVGADGKHLSEVFFRKLFCANALKIIQDAKSGKWRCYDPVLDKDRKAELKPAPPLIPSRFIEGGWKGISWENKKERIPNLIRMKNGWEIRFFPGGGLPPNGVDIDVCALDEECPDVWYSEMSARLLDRKGKFMWSATPQAGTTTLLELHERSERERVLVQEGQLAKPNIEQFDLRLDGNPHIDTEQKRLLELKFRNDPQNYRIRILGEFVAKSYRMYPEWSEYVHSWSNDEFMAKFGRFDVPGEWTRYMVIDPGHTCCAVLFAAVPPSSVGDFVLLYDELYIYNCTADMFGERVRLKTQGNAFEAFIIDLHGSVRTETTGRTVLQQYRDALEKNRVRCHRTGSNFTWGNSDVLAGCEKVRSWLRVRDDGTPKVRVLRERLPNLLMEVKKYRKKVNRNRDGTNVISDMPDQKKDNHLCDCLRYLACFDPQYIIPRAVKRTHSPMTDYLEKKRKQNRKKIGTYVNLGPG